MAYHHLALAARDMAAVHHFYEEVMGFELVKVEVAPVQEGGWAKHFFYRMDGDDSKFIAFWELHDVPGTANLETNLCRAAGLPDYINHIAFAVSKATWDQAVERLDERGIKHSGPKDRGFMDSIYFKDPLGLLIELAAYRFEPPSGHTHADVLLEAHRIRVERGDHHIAQVHLADAIEDLVRRSRDSLSDDRTASDPYSSATPTPGG